MKYSYETTELMDDLNEEIKYIIQDLKKEPIDSKVKREIEHAIGNIQNSLNYYIAEDISPTMSLDFFRVHKEWAAEKILLDNSSYIRYINQIITQLINWVMMEKSKI